MWVVKQEFNRILKADKPTESAARMRDAFRGMEDDETSSDLARVTLEFEWQTAHHQALVLRTLYHAGSFAGWSEARAEFMEAKDRILLQFENDIKAIAK